MQISVPCKCGKMIKTKAENAGKRAKCPACGDIFTIAGPPELDVDSWLQPASASASSAAYAAPPVVSPTVIAPTSPPQLPKPTPVPQPYSRPARLPQSQETIVIGLMAVGLVGLAFAFLKPVKWEYKTVEIRATTSGSSGYVGHDFSATTIPDFADKLKAIGDEGWEMVGVVLESETVHPNFGKSDLVTGLQPNVRCFKRAKWFWK